MYLLYRLQRILLRFLFAEPSKCSYEEAYNYFLKAEELKGKFYIPNLYMLGKLWCNYYEMRGLSCVSSRKSLLFDESLLQGEILL